MAGRDLNYRISVDASAGTAGIRDFSRAVSRELRGVDQSLDDTTTASQRVARALGDMADQAETELRQASRAADALGRALGPELAARMGRDGIAEKVGDLNRLGLSFEEIEADAEQLAAAIKRIDDVQVSAVDQGSATCRQTAYTAAAGDQTRSVGPTGRQLGPGNRRAGGVVVRSASVRARSPSCRRRQRSPRSAGKLAGHVAAVPGRRAVSKYSGLRTKA